MKTERKALSVVACLVTAWCFVASAQTGAPPAPPQLGPGVAGKQIPVIEPSKLVQPFTCDALFANLTAFLTKHTTGSGCWANMSTDLVMSIPEPSSFARLTMVGAGTAAQWFSASGPYYRPGGTQPQSQRQFAFGKDNGVLKAVMTEQGARFESHTLECAATQYQYYVAGWMKGPTADRRPFVYVISYGCPN
jgi:hypothetical protein